MVWVCHSGCVPAWRLEDRLPLMGWGGAWLCRDLTGQGCSPEVSSVLSGCPGQHVLGAPTVAISLLLQSQADLVLLQPWGFAVSAKETEPIV